MKYKVKQDEKKFIVCDENDNVISKWTKELVEKEGGIEKVIERFKKAFPKLEVTVE